MEWQLTAHITTWSTTPMCPSTIPGPWGNTPVHGVFYHMVLAFGMFFPDRLQDILHPRGGAGFSKCSYRREGEGVVVSNSISVPLEDKHGEQRGAKHAKHVRHSTKAEPTSRFCCLKGKHHGQSYNIHSHNRSSNGELLVIHYVATQKSTAM